MYHGREQRRACARASAYPAAQYDWNSLIAASDSGHDKAVALLLDRGAKINATDEVTCGRARRAAPPRVGSSFCRRGRVRRTDVLWCAVFENGWRSDLTENSVTKKLPRKTGAVIN